MTDERIRRLEHRWRETDAAEDEAAYLRALARAGRLKAGRLALAAFLRHPAALLTSEGGPFTPASEKELEVWVNGLQGWGNEVLIRSSIASARALLPLWYHTQAGDDRPRRAIEAAEAFLLCPCPEHGELAIECDSLAVLARDNLAALGDEAAVVADVAHLTATTAVWEYRLFHHPKPSFRGYGREIEETIREGARDAAMRVATTRSVKVAVAAIQTALIPWVLGRSDPVADARPTWLSSDAL